MRIDRIGPIGESRQVYNDLSSDSGGYANEKDDRNSKDGKGGNRRPSKDDGKGTLVDYFA